MNKSEAGYHRDKGFIQGYTCAVANLLRSFDEPVIAEEVYGANFHDITELKAAGVDPGDIKVLRPVIKEIQRKSATKEARKLYIEAHNCKSGAGGGSTLREATPEEIEKERALHALGQCSKNVVYDIEGWPYDHRRCGICDADLGVV